MPCKFQESCVCNASHEKSGKVGKRDKFRKWQDLADMIDSRLEVINATTGLIEMEEQKRARRPFPPRRMKHPAG